MSALGDQGAPARQVGRAEIPGQICMCNGPGVGTGERPAWLGSGERGKAAVGTEMGLREPWRVLIGA